MATAAGHSAPVPGPEDIRRIADISDPALRNLQITRAYWLLSRAMTARTGECANWCTFAVWASKQAGQTIRGEDWLEAYTKNTLTGSAFRRPIHAFWRALLRRGLLRPETRLGRAVRAIHTPFDALELASAAVGEGNRKVFVEIGAEFARYLVRGSDFDAFCNGLLPGPPPDGQDLLRSAFRRFHEKPGSAQSVFHANLEIGWHEQARLQPEIQAALEAVPRAAEDLGMRVLQAVYPGARDWKAFVKRPFAAAIAPVARSVSKHARELTRHFITRRLMTLGFPHTTLALGRGVDRRPAAALERIEDAELAALLGRFHERRRAGAADWGSLDQRMSFIAPLFRCFHDCRELMADPFTAEELTAIEGGTMPGGRL